MKKISILILTFILLIGMLPQSVKAAQVIDFEQILTQYLTGVSSERGFEVTKQNLEASLSYYELGFDDFEISSVDDLTYLFGDVIQSDLSNLTELYSTYELDEEALHQLLEENGENVSDYIFLNDLSVAVFFYQEYSNIDENPDNNEDPITYPEIDEELFQSFFTEIGLTENELQKLEAYFTLLEDYFSDPATLEQFLALGERISSLEDIAITDQLTKEQIGNITSIMQDYFTILKLDAVFILIKDGQEVQLSMADLINIKELNQEAIRVELYGTDNQLLADFTITKEALEALYQFVDQTTEEIVTEIEEVIPAQENNSNAQVQTPVKTVKGAKLPKTASDNLANVFFGILITAAGLLFFRKKPNKVE